MTHFSLVKSPKCSLGRMASPKLMNFRKSSKRPLTPPRHFRKIMLRFSRQNCDKSAYVQYGVTVVYYMILFPMRLHTSHISAQCYECNVQCPLLTLLLNTDNPIAMHTGEKHNVHTPLTVHYSPKCIFSSEIFIIFFILFIVFFYCFS